MSLAAIEDVPGLLVNREHLAFQTDLGIGVRATIGLLVLSSDQTIEHEFGLVREALAGVAIYASRVQNDTRITPETLKAMEERLAPAADLILPGTPLDVIAYGCTSGAMTIGPDKVAERVHSVRPEAAVTDPVTAATAGFHSLGVKRLALLTPYTRDINLAMRDYLLEQGFEVPVMGSFNEPDDPTVARISIRSIGQAALEIGREPSVEAVFVSCTNLRVVETAASLESQLGKPVTASNHALAWHALRLAGIADPLPALGRLYECSLAP